MIAVAIFTITASAQEQEQRSEVDKLSAEQIATLRTKKMTLALDLNEKQQAQVHQINLERAKSLKERREDFRARDQKEEKPASVKSNERQDARLDKQIELQKKMKEILSEQQFEKWQKMKDRKKFNRNKMFKNRKSN